jgi:uncharacterized protein with NAD-binding domain and iron-sulfur cluster
MTDSTSRPKTRVAILGGGMSGLTTALALTDPENPRRGEYEVTVYQMGWRLGGKGASGRNLDPAYHNRIQEHGLHIWFGCYDNAFRIMRKAYAELGRSPDAPLATWLDAFHPHSISGVEMHVGHQWRQWIGTFPVNDAVPGHGGLLPLWSYISTGMKMYYANFLGRGQGQEVSPTGNQWVAFPSKGRQKAERHEGVREGRFVLFLSRLFRHLGFLEMPFHLMNVAFVAVNRMLLRRYWKRHEKAIATDPMQRERWVVMHFMFATFAGMVANRVLLYGFKPLNGQDFRDWMARHALDDGGLMLNSAFMIGLYDGMFAYENGDNSKPAGTDWPPHAKMEAGEALKCCLRQALTYRGAGIWKMQAGMGDTVFGPVYEILRRRGVRFAFFHRVDRIHASADASTIERIDVTRQAELVPRVQELGGYQPFIDVKGLPCWPDRPIYRQLVDGDVIRESGINFESYGANWAGNQSLTLERGRDFDQVVLAISIGALPYIACDLMKKSARWRDMIGHVKTTRTLASQVWYRRTAYQLGWTMMQQPVVSGYDTGPFDTWADMSHLIPCEGWQSGGRPGREQYPLNAAYYCGMMADDPPLPDTPCGPMAAYPDQAAEDAKVEGIVREFLLRKVGALFPEANPAPDTFRWEWLVDQRGTGAVGPERLGAQYFRANVEPSERYVLSVPGSDKYRLPAHDEREFTNLYLAGDWTDCGLNMGCIEAATMSGLLAGNALSGYPNRNDIIGLDW